MKIATLLLVLCLSVHAADGPVTTAAKSNMVNSVNTAIIPVTNIDLQIVWNGITNRLVQGSNITISVTSSNVTISATGGSGSQTPWVTPINANDNLLTNRNSYLSLNDDSTFGLYNGEAAGVGADVTVTSINGNVVIPSRLLVGQTADDGTGAIAQIMTLGYSPALSVQGGPVFIGGTGDVTGSALQLGGSISVGAFGSGSCIFINGDQGGSGFSVLDADGLTTHAVSGGIVLP